MSAHRPRQVLIGWSARIQPVEECTQEEKRVVVVSNDRVAYGCLRCLNSFGSLPFSRWLAITNFVEIAQRCVPGSDDTPMMPMSRLFPLLCLKWKECQGFCNLGER